MPTKLISKKKSLFKSDFRLMLLETQVQSKIYRCDTIQKSSHNLHTQFFLFCTQAMCNMSSYKVVLRKCQTY